MDACRDRATDRRVERDDGDGNGGARGSAPPAARRRGEVIACHECGTVHRLPAMPDDTIARCIACGAKIFIRFERSVERTLALYLAALVLFLVANAFPILTMSIGGPDATPARSWTAPRRSTTTACGRWRWRSASPASSLPLAKILGMLAILVPLQLGLRPPWIVAGFRWVERLQPWAMMEVYLLGVIVAYVKLQDLATVHLGVALYRLRRHDHLAGRRRCALRPARDLAPARPAGAVPTCWPRCPAPCCSPASNATRWCAPTRRICTAWNARAAPTPLHHRKPDSLNRTWALVADRGRPLHPGQPAAGA